MIDPMFPVLARARDAAGVEVDVWHVRPERMAQLEAADAQCAAQRVALQHLRAFCGEVREAHANVLRDPVRNNAGRELADLAASAARVLAATPMDDAGVSLLAELRELRGRATR